MDGAEAVTCARCGTDRDPADPAASAWSCERAGDGAMTWLCADCTRRHVRDIEARLAPEWWR